MGLQKAIANGKEKRRPWPHYKMVDRTCCNHGGCSYCHQNRTNGRRKNRAAMNAIAHEAEFEKMGE